LAKSCCGQLPLLEQHEKIEKKKKKKKKTIVLLYSCPSTGIYYKNLAILILIFLGKFWRVWVFFSREKSFV
jgi:hypothetical protein